MKLRNRNLKVSLETYQAYMDAHIEDVESTKKSNISNIVNLQAKKQSCNITSRIFQICSVVVKVAYAVFVFKKAGR